MIRTPDPFRPGHFFEIRNPESIIAGCSRAHCPICNKLLELMKKAEFEKATGFAIVEAG